MLQPAQLDIMQIRRISTLELVCVSNLKDLHIERAFLNGYIFVDCGLSFGLDHRRAFPDAPEAKSNCSSGDPLPGYPIIEPRKNSKVRQPRRENLVSVIGNHLRKNELMYTQQVSLLLSLAPDACILYQWQIRFTGTGVRRLWMMP